MQSRKTTAQRQTVPSLVHPPQCPKFTTEATARCALLPHPNAWIKGTRLPLEGQAGGPPLWDSMSRRRLRPERLLGGPSARPLVSAPSYHAPPHAHGPCQFPRLTSRAMGPRPKASGHCAVVLRGASGTRRRGKGVCVVWCVVRGAWEVPGFTCPPPRWSVNPKGRGPSLCLPLTFQHLAPSLAGPQKGAE